MILRLAVAIIFMNSALATAGAPTCEEARLVMGTLATVRVWVPDESAAPAAIDQAFDSFDRVDSLMSTWREDSALSGLNRAEPGRWVEVGGEVAHVLVTALATAEASEGAFDPTVLPLMFLWGFRRDVAQVPSREELRICLDSVGHEALEIEEATGRARLTRPGMGVDLGGIAKGYALDVAADALRQAGATSGFLDLGGTILVFGQGPAHQVGVLGPEGDQILASLPLVDGAVATSGQYERYVVIDGVRHGHLLDPRSGLTVPSGLSATVLADRAMTADALATAAVVLGPDKGLRLLESQPGVEGVLILRGEDGRARLLSTSGLVNSP